MMTEGMDIKDNGVSLRADEARFRAIMAHTPDHILVQDRDLRYVFVINPQLGLTEKDMIGKTDSDLIAPADAAKLTALKRKVLTTGETVSLDMPIRNSAGKEGYFEGSYVPSYDSAGRIDGIIGYFRNVTDRRRMEESLKYGASREVLLSETAAQLLATDNPQALVESICRKVLAFLDCSAFFNFLVDEKAGKLHLNACAGVPDGELSKIEWLDYGVAVCGCVARDGKRIIAGDIATTVDARTDLVRSYGIQAYCCHPLLAGEKVIGTLSFGASSRSRFSNDDVSLMKAVTDLVAVAMARVRDARLLSEREELFRAAFDDSAVPMSLSEVGGRMLKVNAAFLRMFGYSAEELQALTFFDFTHPDDREATRNGLKPIFDGQKTSFRMEKRYIRKDGVVVWGDMCTGCVRDAQNQPQYFVTHIQDITERKQTEDLLRFLGQCGVSGSGEGFFAELARYLAQTLGMDYICIDRLEADHLSARTLAVFHDGKFEDNVSYTLKDTPCGEVVGRRICCYPDNVRRLFAKDAVLQDLQAESYLGTTLWNAQGKPIGLIAIIGKRPLPDTRMAESILQLVAVRASGELERQLAEEALRESRERIATVFRATPAGVFVTRASDGLFLEVNDAYLRLTGYSAQELLGRTSLELNLWACEEDRRRIVELTLHQPVVDGVEVQLRRKSGEPVDLLVSILAMQWGGVPCILGTLTDITARKKAELALKKSEETLQAILEATSESIWLFDSDGIIMMGNRIAFARLGKTAPELIGKRMEEILPPPVARVRMQKLREVVESAQPLEFEDARSSFLFRHSFYPILDSEQRVVAVVSFSRDITARRKMEEELRKSEQRLRFHFENSPLAVVEWDSGFMVTQWSTEAEHMFGWKKEETIGRRIDTLNIIHPDDVAVVNRTMERLTGGSETTVVSSNRNLTKTGAVIECTWHNSVLPGTDGKMASVMSLVEDITERRQAEEQIRRHVEELRARNDELTRFNRSAVDRELRMIELKKQVNELAAKSGAPPVYNLEFAAK